MWTAQYWKGLLERTAATFIESLLAFLVVTGFDPLHADWSTILVASGTAAGIAALKGLLTNLATKDGPGLTDAEFVRPDKVNGI